MYVFSAFWAAASISSALIFRRVAIWSMKAPVPPAQEPFIRTSVPPVKNRILASSPPSSMMTSVPGTRRLAATRVANTSCTKGTPTLSAMPMPAEPEMANSARPPGTYRSAIRRSSSSDFSRIWLKCRSYVLYTMLPVSSRTTHLMVVDPTSRPTFKALSSFGKTVTRQFLPRTHKIPH